MIKTTAILLLVACAGAVAAAEPRLDAQGDPLPTDALLRLGQLRWRANANLVLVQFRPDGKSLLTVGQDQSAHIWDLATGKQLRHFEISGTAPNAAMGGPVFPIGLGLAVSGNGKVLANLGRDRVIRTWDVDTGKELARWEAQTGGNMRVAVSADGAKVAVAGTDGRIRVWDAAGGEPRIFGQPSVAGVSRGASYRLEFAPDGKSLLQVGLEVTNGPLKPVVVIWDVEAGKERHRFKQFAAGAVSTSAVRASFSPDHTVMALPLRNEIILYDLSDGKELRRLTNAGDGYRAVLTFFPDGKRLFALNGGTENFTIWNVADGTVARQFGKPAGGPQLMSVSAASRMLSTTAFSADGKTLAWIDGATVMLIDTETGKLRNEAFGHVTPLRDADFTPDGKQVITRSVDNAIMRWDATAGRLLEKIDTAKFNGYTTVLSPDSKWAASGDGNGGYRVHDTASGKEQFSHLPDPAQMAMGFGAMAVFAPDSRTFIVVGNSASAAQVYDVARGQKKFELRLPETPQPNANMGVGMAMPMRVMGYRPVFSPDSRWLAIVAETQVWLFDAVHGGSGRKIALREPVRQAAISPDNRALAVEFLGGAVELWELASGARRAAVVVVETVPGNPNFRGQMGRVIYDSGAQSRTLAFSPDGRLLVRANNDGKVRVWDVWTLQELAAIEGHRGGVTALAFAPDGRRLITAGADTTALIWDVESRRAGLRSITAALDPKQVEEHWSALGGGDAGKARSAIVALAGDPAQAVAFLSQRLQPVASPDPQAIEQLVAGLGDMKFATREKSRKELERIGKLALPALRAALKESASAEVRRQAQRLLDGIGADVPTGEQVRTLRALEVLELAGTAEAIAVLRTVAGGAPEVLPTPQAQAALLRLGKPVQ